MDRFSRNTVFNVGLLLLGLVLLVAILVEWTSGARDIDPLPAGHADLEGELLSSNIIRLLDPASGEILGLDRSASAMNNLFQRPKIPLPENALSVEPIPDPTPPAPEPKEVPTSREVSVIYHGHFVSSDGRTLAYLSVDGIVRAFPVGEPLVADWIILQAGGLELVVEDADGETKHLLFNQKKVLDVPIK